MSMGEINQVKMWADQASRTYTELHNQLDALHLEHAQLLRERNKLIDERDAAREKIARIMAGLEGCCMTCEPVGVRNQQMERDIDDLKVCLNATADQVRAQHLEMDTLRAERDAARREVLLWVKERCSWVELEKEIKQRGWTCFRQEDFK